MDPCHHLFPVLMTCTRRMWRVAHVIVVASLLIGAGNALACPAGQYSWMGTCMPEIGGAVGASFEHLKKEIPAQLVGNPLEGWLIASRNTSINGAQPIPPGIRQALSGYISDEIMNIARFRVGDMGAINAAHVIQQWNGHVGAVTLIDVIVFRDASDAYNNPALWAHELTHVKQFKEWGAHSFAISYARNSDEIENPAYAVEGAYPQWAATRGWIGQQQAQWATAPSIGLPSGYGMAACGCYGWTTGLASEPRCQSSAVRATPCAGFCPGGGVPYAWVCQ